MSQNQKQIPLIILLIITLITPTSAALSNLPTPKTPLKITQPYQPLLLKGVSVDEEHPLHLQFLVDPGDSLLRGPALEEEIMVLIKDFLAGLTIPETSLWVNLSPYEQDRIIPDALSQTPMGRDLLSQDYLLKQFTASLTHPDNLHGRAFWDSLEPQALSIDALNKVWIVPGLAGIHVDGNQAFITDAHLKVLMDDDKNFLHSSRGKKNNSFDGKSLEIMRKVILPEVEQEVNQGRHFARLRQIYHSVILSFWFKQHLRRHVLTQVYADQNKIDGINIVDPQMKERIYQQYLDAVKQGVVDLIREEPAEDGSLLPRKYFCGGTTFASTALTFQPPVVHPENIIEVLVELKPASSSLAKVSPVGMDDPINRLQQTPEAKMILLDFDNTAAEKTGENQEGQVSVEMEELMKSLIKGGKSIGILTTRDADTVKKRMSPEFFDWLNASGQGRQERFVIFERFGENELGALIQERNNIAPNVFGIESLEPLVNKTIAEMKIPLNEDSFSFIGNDARNQDLEVYQRGSIQLHVARKNSDHSSQKVAAFAIVTLYELAKKSPAIRESFAQRLKTLLPQHVSVTIGGTGSINLSLITKGDLIEHLIDQKSIPAEEILFIDDEGSPWGTGYPGLILSQTRGIQAVYVGREKDAPQVLPETVLISRKIGPAGTQKVLDIEAIKMFNNKTSSSGLATDPVGGIDLSSSIPGSDPNSLTPIFPDYSPRGFVPSIIELRGHNT